MLLFAKHAEKLAPAAIISRPPDSGKTEDDLGAYWRALASVAKRPVILQTTGGVAYRGPTPSVRLLIELAKEFPHFGYIKEEAGPIAARICELVAARPPIRRVFSAHGGFGWLHESRLGTEGLITECGGVRRRFGTHLGTPAKWLGSRGPARRLQQVPLDAESGRQPSRRDVPRRSVVPLEEARRVQDDGLADYGPHNTIPSPSNYSELKLTNDAIAEIDRLLRGIEAVLEAAR